MSNHAAQRLQDAIDYGRTFIQVNADDLKTLLVYVKTLEVENFRMAQELYSTEKKLS